MYTFVYAPNLNIGYEIKWFHSIHNSLVCDD